MSHRVIIIIITLYFSSTVLSASSFDINQFSNPFKYEWSDEEERLRSRDNLFLETMLLDKYNEQKQSAVVNALKTSIAPGWGHFSVESYTKGQVFLGIQLVLLGTGMYFRDKAMIEHSKYEQATQIDDIVKYYDQAQIPFRQSGLLFSLWFIVWGYTIYDVVIETNQYNWDLWDSIRESNLTITPTSISYRF